LVRTVAPAEPHQLWRCPRCKAVMLVTERLTATQLFWKVSARAFADSS